jgi:arabinosaccharide transport system substrate-binding protein
MKKLLQVITILAIFTSIVGCANKNSSSVTKTTDQSTVSSTPDNQDSATTKGGMKNIVIWTFAETHNKYYSTIVKPEYEKNHPGVTVDIKVLDYSALYDKYTVIAKSGGKDAPDIIDVEQGAFSRYINGNVPFEPLNDYLQRDNLSTAIPKGRQDLYTVDGKIYGIEIAACVAALYYRIDLYDAAGIDVKQLQTWDAFTDASKKLIGKDKFIFSGTAKDQGLFEELLRQEGQDIVTSDGKIGFNTPEAVSVLKRIRNWKDAGLMDKSSPDGPQLWAGYKKGKYIAGLGADWWGGWLVTNVADLKGKWAAVPVPLGGPNSVPTTVVGGTGMVMTKFSKNKELAWDFIKQSHLDTAMIAKSFQIIGLFPALQSAANDPILHEKSPLTEYFGGQDMADLFGSLVSKAPSQYQAWWRSLVGKAWDKYESDYQKDKTSPEDFLNNVAKETQKLIDSEKGKQN